MKAELVEETGYAETRQTSKRDPFVMVLTRSHDREVVHNQL